MKWLNVFLNRLVWILRMFFIDLFLVVVVNLLCNVSARRIGIRRKRANRRLIWLRLVRSIVVWRLRWVLDKVKLCRWSSCLVGKRLLLLLCLFLLFNVVIWCCFIFLTKSTSRSIRSIVSSWCIWLKVRWIIRCNLLLWFFV